jgi:hypothetical protein
VRHVHCLPMILRRQTSMLLLLHADDGLEEGPGPRARQRHRLLCPNPSAMDFAGSELGPLLIGVILGSLCVFVPSAPLSSLTHSYRQTFRFVVSSDISLSRSISFGPVVHQSLRAYASRFCPRWSITLSIPGLLHTASAFATSTPLRPNECTEAWTPFMW